MRRSLWQGCLLALAAVPAAAREDASPGPPPDVPRLIHEARRGDWNTRIHAVHTLGLLGSVEGLSEGLGDGDWQVRLTAVHWLGRAGDRGVGTLARALPAEPCKIIRLAAIHWLGSTGANAIPALKAAADEASPSVRLTTAYWLRKLQVGADPSRAFEPPSIDDPGLLQGATAEDLRGCEAVNLPPRRVQPLPEPDPLPAPIAGDPDATVAEAPGYGEEERPRPEKGGGRRKGEPRRPAEADLARAERTRALELLPDAPLTPDRPQPSLPPDPAPPAPGRPVEEAALPPAAPSPSAEEALAPSPPLPPLPPRPPKGAPEVPAPSRAPSAEPELARPLPGEAQAKLPPVPAWRLVRRDDASYDLALREPEAAQEPRDPLPELIRALRSPNWRSRSRAADLLGMMGQGSAPAVPALIAAMKDKKSAVRASAALALGNIGSAADKAVPALTRALRDREMDVRYSAAVALGRMGTPAANRAFQRHLRGEAARLIKER
ncbi:MAG: HEAT repeat domain-containing protein [Elusimicrobia bacterium]|nr:HEAT repeat domain-containing protein [Elusimicrobiota bacterium]